jgi:hypothetical protein
MKGVGSFATVVVLAGVLSSSALAQDQGSGGGDQSAVRQPHALMDSSPQERSQELSFFIGLPWYYGFGLDLAVRYSIPIVQNGFIPKLNNSFEIEFGGDFAYAGLIYAYPYLVFTGEAAARWTFKILPKLAAYAKAGLGIGYAVYTGCSVCDANFVAWYPLVGVGIIYWVGDKFVLRAEATTHDLRVGIGIDF